MGRGRKTSKDNIPYKYSVSASEKMMDSNDLLGFCRAEMLSVGKYF